MQSSEAPGRVLTFRCQDLVARSVNCPFDAPVWSETHFARVQNLASKEQLYPQRKHARRRRRRTSKSSCARCAAGTFKFISGDSCRAGVAMRRKPVNGRAPLTATKLASKGSAELACGPLSRPVSSSISCSSQAGSLSRSVTVGAASCDPTDPLSSRSEARVRA